MKTCKYELQLISVFQYVAILHFTIKFKTNPPENAFGVAAAFGL